MKVMGYGMMWYFGLGAQEVFCVCINYSIISMLYCYIITKFPYYI